MAEAVSNVLTVNTTLTSFEIEPYTRKLPELPLLLKLNKAGRKLALEPSATKKQWLKWLSYDTNDLDFLHAMISLNPSSFCVAVQDSSETVEPPKKRRRTG